MGTDQTEADLALKQFIDYQLDDIHSMFNYTSYMSHEEAFRTQASEMK